MSTTPAEDETGTSTDDQVREYYHRILPFYETELKDRGDEELWVWAASEPAGCRVLEIGAGTGRATRFLARTAGRVVAFDSTLEMIAVARRRFAAQPHVSLLAADLRTLQLAERFDLIAAVDDPFVHLTADEERERAFVRVAEHLAPHGRFLLDAAWLPPELRRTAEEGGLVEEREVEGGLSVRRSGAAKPAAGSAPIASNTGWMAVSKRRLPSPPASGLSLRSGNGATPPVWRSRGCGETTTAGRGIGQGRHG